MTRKYEDLTIKKWQNTIEPAPEGTQEFILPESEDESASRRIQYDPKSKLFRSIFTHPSDAVANYNSGWLERNKMIETLQNFLPQKDFFSLLGFIHEKEPFEE